MCGVMLTLGFFVTESLLFSGPSNLMLRAIGFVMDPLLPLAMIKLCVMGSLEVATGVCNY